MLRSQVHTRCNFCFGTRLKYQIFKRNKTHLHYSHMKIVIMRQNMTFSYVNLGATRNVYVCPFPKRKWEGWRERINSIYAVVLINKSVLLPIQGGTVFWFFEQLMLVIKDFVQNQLN